jgi:hypothetical protein
MVVLLLSKNSKMDYSRAKIKYQNAKPSSKTKNKK